MSGRFLEDLERLDSGGLGAATAPGDQGENIRQVLGGENGLHLPVRSVADESKHPGIATRLFGEGGAKSDSLDLT